MKKNLLALWVVAFVLVGCKTSPKINGEVFVEKNGAGKYKLGSIQVSAFRKSEFEKQIAAHEDQIVKTARSAMRDRQTCADRVGYVNNSNTWRTDLSKCFATEMDVISLALTKALSATKPVGTGTTNSEGQFTITIPEAGEYVLISVAQRSDGTLEEKYFFYHPVSVDGNDKSEILSNADLLNPITLITLFPN